MIAEAALSLGRRVAGANVTGASSYWRGQCWDRESLERDPHLGGEYVTERNRISDAIARHAGPGMRAADIACGTGVFSAALAATQIANLEMVDISPTALGAAQGRIGPDPRVTATEGDFWSLALTEPADLLVCVDALHHLGMPAPVLARMREFGHEGTRVIGNYWTGDNFHTFSRLRHGRLHHDAWCVHFMGAAILSRLTGTHPDVLRTVWLTADEVQHVLASAFSAVEELTVSQYFVSFVAVI